MRSIVKSLLRKAKGSPVITYQSLNASPTGSGTATLTYPASSIGSNFSNTRRVIAFVYQGNQIANSASIGGVPCDVVVNLTGSANARLIMCSAIVPTGATADLVLNLGGNGSVFSIAAFYTCDDSLLQNRQPLVANNALVGTAASVSIDSTSVAGGFMIAVGCDSGGSAIVWPSSSTETLIADANFGQNRSSHKNGVSLNPANSVAMTWTGSVSGIIAIFAWK
jgi:hypothetical protein